MNDIELDEMLSQWGVPRVRAELRKRVQAEYITTPKRERRRFFVPVSWKGLFTGMAAAAVLFLFVITAAFPQSVGLFSGGYTTESDVVRYRADGSENVSHVTSFVYGGNTIYKVKDSNMPLTSLIQEIAFPVHSFLLQVAPSMIPSAQTDESIARHRALVSNGCVGPGWTVIGHETVLGHATTVVKLGGTPDRIIQWMAPDLDCSPLRLTVEDAQPDGSLRWSIKSRAVKVTMNH